MTGAPQANPRPADPGSRRTDRSGAYAVTARALRTAVVGETR
ncbi:MAG: hypothetical protein ACLQQB_05275 [Solirubrobacteraceae bacterium]|jgi:hypothetical protein